MRTWIQLTALLLVVISSYFLIKSIIGMSVRDMAALSKSYFDVNLNTAKNLTQQKADVVVGFVLLLISIFLYLVNLLWPMRWIDFGVSWIGVFVSLVSSVVVFCAAKKSSQYLQQMYYKKVENALKDKVENG